MNAPTALPFFAAAVLAASSLPLMSQMPLSESHQQVRSFSKKLTRTVRLDYLLFLPPAYDAKPARTWPLLLFLHGAGERGHDLALVTKHGPPKLVAERPDLPFIIVSPQCPAGQVWNDDALLALLDHVQSKWAVDPRRVYLTGLSMGGYGTWSLGLKHPERFAALAPICGGGDTLPALLPDPQKAPALRTLPVWAFHGAKDPVVPAIESERMVQALQRAGHTNVQLTLYPEATHDSWTTTYANPKFYDWLLAQERKPSPRPRAPRSTP